MTAERKLCCAMVWKSWHEYPCRANASIEREGKWYCKRHDPVARKARDDAAFAKYQREYKLAEEKARLTNAAPALLEAAEAALLVLGELEHDGYGYARITIDKLRAAIAKARGEA